MATTINASTSSGLVNSADTSGIIQLQSNGVTQQTIDSTGSYGQLKQGTAVATTSGTSVTFSSIPSWAKRITVMFNGVSTNGTSNIVVRLGTSGGIVSSGYTGVGMGTSGGSGGVASYTSGFGFTDTTTASQSFIGQYIISNISGNTWVATTAMQRDTGNMGFGSGSVSLANVLTQIQVITLNGTDTFDAGSVNILYEG